MLTVRFGQLTVEGLSPSKIHSLAGCSHTPSRSGMLGAALLGYIAPFSNPPFTH